MEDIVERPPGRNQVPHLATVKVQLEESQL